MIQFFNRRKGSISIFLVMVMLPMCSCVSLAVYAARLKSVENELKEGMKLTGNAVLSDYDKVLMELYGFTAFSMSSTDTDKYEKYISANVSGVYDFHMTSSDKNKLSDIANLESMIIDSMSYKAPYNWVSLVSKKFSLFSQISEIENVIKKSSEYFKALSETKDGVKEIYESIANINLNESNADIVEKLKNVAKSTRGMTRKFEAIDKKVDTLKKSIDEIKNTELKTLLESDCNSSSDYLKGESITSFEKSLTDDIEKISNMDDTVDISDLSFINTPFYEYVTVSGAESKKEDGSSEKQTFKSTIDSISGMDLKSISEKVSDIRINELIGEEIYSEIVGSSRGENKKSEELSENSEIGISQAYIAEFVSDRFTCLTSENTGKPWLPEIEYLVFGNENMRTDVSLCVESIYAVRLVLNSLFALTNTKMRQTALSVAAAVAGVTGLGVSIAKNIILLSWAAAESVVDTYLLCRGETVPVYKSISTWNLTFANVPGILEKGVTEYAGVVVDDVFSQIENFSANKVSEVKGAISGYVEKTSSGIAESVASAIVTPLENKITLMLSGVKINYSKEDIKKILKKIVDELPCESEAMKVAKEFFLSNCLDSLALFIYEKLPDVFSSDKELWEQASDAIRNAINSVYEKLMEKVNSKLSTLEEKVNGKMNEILNAGKENIKGRLNGMLDDYAKEISVWSGDDGKSFSILNSSGIAMSYKDYLKLFLYLGLVRSTSKQDILKRAEVIIQLNCKEKNPKFNILKCNTGVRLGGKVRVFEKEIKLEKTYLY